MSALNSELALIAFVSASHMSMPNHWLPYSLVARAQNWPLRKCLFLVFLGALGHVTSTILVMLLVSGFSASLISEHAYRVLSSLVLLVFGLYYLYTYFVTQRRDSCCDGNKDPNKSDSLNVNNSTAAVSLVMLTTLSPCVGSMPVLLAVFAPPVETHRVLMTAATLLFTASSVMAALAAISYLGAKSLNVAAIRRHERLVMGIALVALAIATFLIFSNHAHHHHHHHTADMHSAVKADALDYEDAHIHHDMDHHHHHHAAHDMDRVLRLNNNSPKEQVLQVIKKD